MDAQLVTDLFRLSHGKVGYIDVEAFYALHPTCEEVYRDLYTLGDANLVTISWDDDNRAKIIYIHPAGISFAREYGILDEA